MLPAFGVSVVFMSPQGQKVAKQAAHVVAQMCQPTPLKDPCDDLKQRVRLAKDRIRQNDKKGEAVCRDGMSRYQLQQRVNDWINLASARAQRDQTCHGGDDENRQIEQATAWHQLSNCQGFLR
ncbi:hypothetical protein [Amantichitinum ursilacus]|nr:hypothetical protein [Amantichitinum ursilacus]